MKTILNFKFDLQRQLLSIINQATELEFIILKQIGETEATISELDEIQNVQERASSYFSKFLLKYAIAA